ncbi:MAG: GH39 family glycosyl hydrolase [Steroidobacteraceae bacterium]
MKSVQGPRDLFWQDCVGAGHAPLMLRKANQAQLRRVHRDIGFRYVRFHGIFTHTRVYRESNGRAVYGFSEVDAIYEAVLHAGMKPFVEISFMPDALASGRKTIFYWKANGSPPRDYGKWAGLVTAFIRNLESHFGKTEVESWRFEVWNEPNLDGFWTNGDQQAYFHLYDVTVRAIKAVDPDLPVGGPATAGAAWIPEFLRHARMAKVPVDFVTTHTYGVNGGFFDENGQADVELSSDAGSIIDDVLSVRRRVTAAGLPRIPVYFTEWSTSYNSRDPVHDAYLSAPYILEKLKRAQGAVQAMSYWTYSDLFEEAGPPPASFHGGFGLLNREGIRKSAFFAYKYLDELGPEVLRDQDPQSWLTRDGHDFSGLIWDYTPPHQTAGDRSYFRRLHPSKPLLPVRLTVSSLRPGTYRLSVFRTGYRANDPYSQYIEWGLPTNLTPVQIEFLERLTRDKSETRIVQVGADGNFHWQIPIRTNDVVLIELRSVAISSLHCDSCRKTSLTHFRLGEQPVPGSAAASHESSKFAGLRAPTTTPTAGDRGAAR